LYNFSGDKIKLSKIKPIKIVVSVVLTALLLMSIVSLAFPAVKAQAQDSVTLFSAIGGSYANPDGSTQDPGTYNYTDGSTQTFTAVPGTGFLFSYWTIASAEGAYSSSDNPLSLTLNESAFAVQAYFAPEQPFPVLGATVTSSDAIVVVVGGVGGTVSPAPGTYALANAQALDLTATPDSGWTFSHWVIAGTPLSHGAYAFTDTPTNNPYNVNHGYGYTYSYQPVFSPVSTSTSTSPTVNEFSSATAIIIAIVLAIAAFGTFAYTKRAKK
jgi:hypothetical protein